MAALLVFTVAPSGMASRHILLACAQQLHRHIAVRLHIGGGQLVLFPQDLVIEEDTVMGQREMSI